MDITKEVLKELIQDFVERQGLGEADFVCFPSPTGLLLHNPSGVAFNPTWRGLEAVTTIHRALDDLEALMGDGFALNPAAMPRQATTGYAEPSPSTTNVTAPQVLYTFPDVYVWEPASDEAIKITLKIHQDSLGKNEQTASQIVRYVAGVKVGSYEGKRVLTFVNKAGDAIFAPMWENPAVESWKSPFDKSKGWGEEFIQTASQLAVDRFKGIIRFNGYCSFKLNEEGKKDKNGLLYASFYKFLGMMEGFQVVE